MTCEHDSRFSGVFDLPKDCGGCLACHAEHESERYRKLAAALQYNEGDRTISPAAELERLQGEVEHRETLLGYVWDFARDNNYDYRGRINLIMEAIREKPGG